MNDKDRNKVNGLIKIYQKRTDNVQWHIDTNKPLGWDLEKCQLYITAYKDVISDLQSLVSPIPTKF